MLDAILGPAQAELCGCMQSVKAIMKRKQLQRIEGTVADLIRCRLTIVADDTALGASVQHVVMLR